MESDTKHKNLEEEDAHKQKNIVMRMGMGILCENKWVGIIPPALSLLKCSRLYCSKHTLISKVTFQTLLILQKRN